MSSEPLPESRPLRADEGLVLLCRHILSPPFSPAFPGGLWFDNCIVESSEAEHMSQMHYLFAFSTVCFGLESQRVACLYIHRAVEKGSSRQQPSFRYTGFSEI